MEETKVLEIRDSKSKPFKIAKVQINKEAVFVVVLGNFKLETNRKSFESVEQWLKGKPYEAMFMIAESVVNFYKNK